MEENENRDAKNKENNEYDFSLLDIQYEQHYFAMIPVCTPHEEHKISRPYAYLCAEIRRICKKSNITFSEMHANERSICVVCNSNDDKEQ